MNIDCIEVIGPIVNAGASLELLGECCGFRFEALPEREARSLFGKIVGHDVSKEFYFYIDHSTDKILVARKTLAIPTTELSSFGLPAHGDTHSVSFKIGDPAIASLIQGMRLLRLWRPGGVWIPYFHFYANLPAGPMGWGYKGVGQSHAIGEDRFTVLDAEDALALKRIVESPPEFSSYLTLALENYEASYGVYSEKLAFLSLMIALEVLFNAGKDQIRYTISRNLAVLLGESETAANDLFKEMKGLYDFRSALVHRGEKKIGLTEVLRSRHLVREAIKKALSIGKSKDDLLAILTAAGFGTLR